tara:strand:+ start:69 stop:794 length:726 start_codon:yes stop_codon:yes gene_type:complete
MKKIVENIKTIFYALIIALIIRSFLFQPFYIPSSSMEPTLLVGDRLFVNKFTYGYSRHSFPFSPNLFNGRILNKKPERGDVIVFKTPADNRTDYIKRVIGLPGDSLQITDGDLYINNILVRKNKIEISKKIYCDNGLIETDLYEEVLPNGVKYLAVYRKNGSMMNTDKFIVPDHHYFFMGDNRDCSRDSRSLSSVGYVHVDNLVGKAKLIFFSNDKNVHSFLKFWKWNESVRTNRFFSKIY